MYDIYFNLKTIYIIEILGIGFLDLIFQIEKKNGSPKSLIFAKSLISQADQIVFYLHVDRSSEFHGMICVLTFANF